MIEPITSQRLYQQVARQIEQLIGNGRILAGDRLPAEKELARQLGVSRPTVREAMIALEIAGLIEVRTGSGIYVREQRSGQDVVLESGPGPFEILSARILVEGEIAASAATKATPEDLSALCRTIDEMEAEMARGEHARGPDRAFHTRMAAITGNSVLTSLVDMLWANMFGPMFETLSEHTGLVKNQEMTLRDHRAIVDALETADPVGARNAMRLHLSHVESVLSRDHDLDG